MRAIAPLPITDEFAPDYTKARGHQNVDRAWALPDAQGMYPRPPGKHGGWDIFAPADHAIVAPLGGRVVRADPSRGSTGQVFGGVLAIESPEGTSFLMRHVVPERGVGAPVDAGERVARVSPWDSGWPHLHLECLHRWPSTYQFSETFDPAAVEWVTGELAPEMTSYYLEDMPHNLGGSGPVVVRRSPHKAAILAAEPIHRALGRIVTRMRDVGGDYCLLWWLPGTHAGGLPIFGPWSDQSARDRTAEDREANRGRPVRRYEGRVRSVYPIPA